MQSKLKHHRIPEYLVSRVQEYFDYNWQKTKFLDNKNDFSMLSKPLQNQIHIHIHKDIVKNVPLFQDLELNEVVWIIQRLKSDIYLPEDFIIREVIIFYFILCYVRFVQS